MKRMTSSNYNPWVNCIYSSSCSHIKHNAPVCPERARYDRLADIEDILGDEYGLDELREMVQAKREGRIVLRSAGAGKKCGSCGHFHRIPGTKRGTCAIRRWERNRLGQTEPWRHSFTPSQSYGACRDYIPREDDNHG